MKTSILIPAIVACALSAPIVSAQEKPAPTKPAMSMDMDKHMGQMQENMKLMRGMGGPMMMGGQKGGGMMGGDPKQRQEMMEKRMDMMQMMMEQMMQHDQMMESMPAK